MLTTEMGARPMRVAAIAVALAVCTGCAATAPLAGSGGEAFWAPIRMGGADEVEGYATLSETASSADIVVIGRFSSVKLGRTINGDAPQDEVAYAEVRVEVSEASDGSTAVESLPLEFLLPDPSDPSAQVEGMSQNLPRGQVVLILRAKRGIGEAGLFRLVNSNGFFTATDRSPVDTPLAEMAPDQSGVYEAELASVDSLGALWELLKRHA